MVINSGSNERPAWEEPELIYSEGQPIRVLRDEILRSNHWHNMGYPYPVFVDWDGDGRPDLLGCVEWSVYPFYCHAALEMERHPTYRMGKVRSL